VDSYKVCWQLRPAQAGSASAGKPAALAAASVFLDPAKWSPRNHALLTSIIAKHGNTSKTYNPKRRPYAVFDWDNTSIMNDCEEALLMYQINHLAFKLSPAEFSAIIRQNVPAGPFAADFKNSAGKIVDLESICADLDSDYAFLHANFKGMAGSKSLEEVARLNNSRISAPSCISCTKRLMTPTA
jgi:hypothetical protein